MDEKMSLTDGVTKAGFIYFSVGEIFDFAKVPFILFESH